MLRWLKIFSASTARASSRMQIGIARHHTFQRFGEDTSPSRDMWRRKSPSVKTPANLPRALTTLTLPDLARVMTSKRFLDGQVFAGDGVAFAGAHDVADLEQHRAANRAGGMMPGVILFLEAARLQHRHGQRVAHHQHGGGAGGRARG